MRRETGSGNAVEQIAADIQALLERLEIRQTEMCGVSLCNIVDLEPEPPRLRLDRNCYTWAGLRQAILALMPMIRPP